MTPIATCIQKPIHPKREKASARLSATDGRKAFRSVRSIRFEPRQRSVASTKPKRDSTDQPRCLTLSARTTPAPTDHTSHNGFTATTSASRPKEGQNWNRLSLLSEEKLRHVTPRTG